MSNRSSDQLFRLIKSLTKQEKRHFKIFASRHTLGDQNNYVLLFDELDDLKEYDEAALLKKFRKEAFTNNFSITKSRLYDTVLRSLDVYHHNSSVDAQLWKDLHCAEILYKKTLYDQCAKILSSAKKLARKFEKHAVIEEIHQMEKDLLEKDNYSGLTETGVMELQQDDELIADKIRVFNDFWNIKTRLFMLLNKRGKVRNQEELSDFKKIIDNTLLREESSRLSVNARYLFSHIYSAYYFGIGDYEECYVHLQSNVTLVESHAILFRERPNVQFSLLTNIIYVGSQLKRYYDVFTNLGKLRRLRAELDTAKNEDMEIKLFSSVLSLEITLYNNTGDFEKAIALIPEIEEGLEKFAGRLSKLREAYFFFNVASAYFGSAKYSQALKWINRLLNDSGIAENEYIHCMGQIFNLIIHIELKNNDLLAYTVKSTHRYLKLRNRAYKFETVFLQFTEKIVKAPEAENLKSYYKDLMTELHELEKDPFERSAFEYFNFIAWVESKLEKRSFKEIVEKQAKA
ncbi:MAG: hypothetical protein FD123_1273 [Bacteroidetes bacterium]|nr:MAG: hypothetical protein FD123_1273 [Bacteroidota bacterium]